MIYWWGMCSGLGIGAPFGMGSSVMMISSEGCCEFGSGWDMVGGRREDVAATWELTCQRSVMRCLVSSLTWKREEGCISGCGGSRPVRRVGPRAAPRRGGRRYGLSGLVGRGFGARSAGLIPAIRSRA